MRKWQYLIFIICILFIVNVKADNSLELVCNTPKMFIDGYTNCDIMLNYDTPVSLVEFNYESVMNVTFTKGEDTSLTVNDNKVILNYSNPITPKNIKILNVKVSNNDSELGDKKLLLKNIRVTSNETSYSLNNQEKVISVITQDELSSDCKLSSLTIDGESVKGFAPTKYKYSGIIFNKRTVFIDAKRSDEHSSATGLGNIILTKDVEKNFDIVVTAENGTKCTYTLGITYLKEENKIAKSDNNNLSSLELYNKDEKINFTFDNKKNNFDIKVANEIKDLTIKAILEDEKASFVSKFGPRDVRVEEGKNSFEIKVQSESEQVKTYTLNITRDKGKSGDTTLKSLVINSVNVLLELNEFNYEITLPDMYDKTDIKAVANDSESKVTFENIDILKNDDNVVTIKVEAPNGDVSEYKVTIDQEEKEEVKEKPKFQQIIVTGYNLNFDINKSEYTLLIPTDVDSLDIKTLPSNIDITVLNNANLKDGSIITVKVIDGEIERTYQIKIEKRASNNTNILCYLFFIVAIVVLLISIRYWVKNKK